MGMSCNGHRAHLGSGPGSLSSSLALHGQPDQVWYLLYFHQEQGGQPAVLNQGIVSFLYRNRAFGEKENSKTKSYLKMHFSSPYPTSKTCCIRLVLSSSCQPPPDSMPKYTYRTALQICHEPSVCPWPVYLSVPNSSL